MNKAVMLLIGKAMLSILNDWKQISLEFSSKTVMCSAELDH